jgi:Fe-Mn family superoxide dismutase
MAYNAQDFNIPDIPGLSSKQLEVHLGLYKGYVTHVNLITQKLGAMRNGAVKEDPYVEAELRRRFAFEFDGMRMHENYFEQLEGGGAPIDNNGFFAKKVSEKYGDVQDFQEHIRQVAGSRGIGWVVVYYDPKADTVHTVFAGDHELGHLSGLPILYCVDMWEHAFMVDYIPSEKAKYLEIFMNNTNWKVVEDRFAKVK